MNSEAGVDPQVLQRIPAWIVGVSLPFEERVIVTECADSIDWLAQSNVLVDASTFVVCALPRRVKVRLPDSVGTWVRAYGSTSVPGDELILSRDHGVETIDYTSSRYLTAAGPTAVRVTSVEDALELVLDVQATLRSGQLPVALTSPMVELADQCAIAGSTSCPGRKLARLHVDGGGAVRSAPGGAVLGVVGDDSDGILEGARSYEGDPCLEEALAAALSDLPRLQMRMFLAGLNAVRVLGSRTSTAWRVVGWGTSSGHPICNHAGQMILTNETDYVFYEDSSRRAFRLNPTTAGTVQAVLSAHSDEEAVLLCREATGRHDFGTKSVGALEGEFLRRGVHLERCAS